MNVEKMREAYSEDFEIFCAREGYAGDIFKANLWKVWQASRESMVIDFSQLNVQHASYNNVDCYAISDVGVILRESGLKVKPCSSST